MKKLFLVLMFCLMIAGCYFHPRSPADFPTQLKTVYFAPEREFSTLAIQLRALLKSMDVRCVKNPSDATYTLKITHDYFSYTRADVVDATLPSTMSFTQVATISVIDNRNTKVLVSQLFSSSNTVILNANQVYTASSNDLIRQELNHNLISLIYYWLISMNTKNAIAHANNAKTIVHASR
ncbi:MAG: hypothetical protein Q8L78_06580 [Coxiellaceae bacterium]|nr:hypothetical protein [Coxiellaceae bacterium]